MIKFTVILEKTIFGTWQNWCFGQFYNSKICKMYVDWRTLFYKWFYPMVKSAASSIYHSINMQQSYHDHHMDDSMQEKKDSRLSNINNFGSKPRKKYSRTANILFWLHRFWLHGRLRISWYTLCCKCLGSFAFLWCKMPMFWRAGMREGGKPLPLAFQYLIFMV